MDSLTIPYFTLDDNCEALRKKVRSFLGEVLPDYPAKKRAHSWAGFDAEFSRKLGARGWIGMTWPRQYGGHERSMLERYVVLEEILAAGAPCASHWIGDRQSGPLLLRYASERIKQEVVPRIASGELCFCIGMSEPDTGSDLASVRSRATRSANGWVINGTKLWTTFGHRSQYMIALVRTSGNPESRHEGLSQLLIDLSLPGVTVRPIRNIAGEEHFNEVVFENVEVAEDCLIGSEGSGWKQVTSELALERSGPERYLSSIQLLIEMISAADESDSRHCVVLGTLVAEMATLRQMSLGVAGMLSRGESPALLASIVKDQGALLEQKIPQLAHELFGVDLAGSGSLNEVMSYIVQSAPSFSLRGGTREILRGIIAKGLGLR